MKDAVQHVRPGCGGSPSMRHLNVCCGQRKGGELAMVLRLVAEEVEAEWMQVTLMSDQRRKIWHVVNECLPSILHFFCTHLYTHKALKNTDKATGNAFVKAINVWTVDRLAFVKAKYLARSHAYSGRFDDEHQHELKHRLLYGINTTQGSEFINNANRLLQGLDIYSAFVRLVEKDHDWYQGGTNHSSRMSRNRHVDIIERVNRWQQEVETSAMNFPTAARMRFES